MTWPCATDGLTLRVLSTAQPVSKPAKDAALVSAAGMLRDGGDYAAPAHLPGVCTQPDACVRPQHPLWKFAAA